MHLNSLAAGFSSLNKEQTNHRTITSAIYSARLLNCMNFECKFQLELTLGQENVSNLQYWAWRGYFHQLPKYLLEISRKINFEIK